MVMCLCYLYYLFLDVFGNSFFKGLCIFASRKCIAELGHCLKFKFTKNLKKEKKREKKKNLKEKKKKIPVVDTPAVAGAFFALAVFLVFFLLEVLLHVRFPFLVVHVRFPLLFILRQTLLPWRIKHRLQTFFPLRVVHETLPRLTGLQTCLPFLVKQRLQTRLPPLFNVKKEKRKRKILIK